MLYVSNGNVYVRGDDGSYYPVDVSVTEKTTETKEIESFKLTRKESSVELPPDATSATVDEIIGKFALTADKPLTFDQAKHDEAMKGDEEEPSKKSEVVVSIKTDGSYLGINYADLGTFQVDGLKITGTAKQATAQGWNGEGQDKTGYFIGLHVDNCKLLKTANHPDGKTSDDGDWLLLLGEESPTLSYIEVEDNAGKSDRYTVSVTTAGKVNMTRRRKVARA